MLSVIIGGQGSGKTFYCVESILNDLKNTNRSIVTNLPIFPDKIASKVANTPVAFHETLNRIYLFTGKSLSEMKYLRKNNPTYFKECQANILDEKNIRCFWNYVHSNSIIYIDEAYEHLGNTAYSKKDPESIKMREEMRSYIRQHRHKKHDIFLISHSYSDLDSHIRRGIQFVYEVSNSLYENIVPVDSKFGQWFRGFRWPVQFFITRGFRRGNETKTPDEKKITWPDKRIFALYDSFSNTNVLEDADHNVNDSQESTDTKPQGISTSLVKVFQANKFLLILFFCFIVGGYVLYGQYRAFLAGLRPKPQKQAITEQAKKVSDKKPVIQPKNDIPKKEVIRKSEVSEKKGKLITPVIITNRKVKFSNGQEMRINDYVQGFRINKITKRYVVVSANNKFFRVAHVGLLPDKYEPFQDSQQHFQEQPKKTGQIATQKQAEKQPRKQPKKGRGDNRK